MVQGFSNQVESFGAQGLAARHAFLFEVAILSPILPTLSTENDRQRHEFERRQINSQLRIGELEQEINSLYGWLAEHMPDATLVPASTAGAVLAVLDKYRLSIEALEKEAAELRSQIAQLDADNAALIRRNKDLADELKRARLDAALTAFEPPTVASATILNTDHPNGTTITVTPAPAAKASMWDDPASLTTLPADILDYWDGIAAGRWTWRRCSKPWMTSTVPPTCWCRCSMIRITASTCVHAVIVRSSCSAIPTAPRTAA